MEQNLNPQSNNILEQNPKANNKTYLIIGLIAFAITLVLDYITAVRTYVSPYSLQIFAGGVISYILELYILLGLLKLFKITDTIFSNRVILLGIFSLAFDIMQYFFLPDVGKGDVADLVINVVVALVILYILIKDVYKTKFSKTIGLSLVFLVSIFLTSGLMVAILTKFNG